ncbi:hypothetical protein [Haloglomus halophilum]|uniref:hypothetical protein n=1 Tax=Haloglomus halophilum TaxID=2962672 RepID=UPI0020C97E97|nr:hypothetical protein [Haloglomus halophilum]
MTNDTEEAGGIGGKKLAIGAVLVVGVVLLVRALRGGDGDEDDTTGETPSTDIDSVPGQSGGDATDALPVDTDVEGRFDEIDIVDAVYILVAGLKAAREEYQQRTDDGGA